MSDQQISAISQDSAVVILAALHVTSCNAARYTHVSYAITDECLSWVPMSSVKAWEAYKYLFGAKDMLAWEQLP